MRSNRTKTSTVFWTQHSASAVSQSPIRLQPDNPNLVLLSKLVPTSKKTPRFHARISLTMLPILRQRIAESYLNNRWDTFDLLSITPVRECGELNLNHELLTLLTVLTVDELRNERKEERVSPFKGLILHSPFN